VDFFGYKQASYWVGTDGLGP